MQSGFSHRTTQKTVELVNFVWFAIAFFCWFCRFFFWFGFGITKEINNRICGWVFFYAYNHWSHRHGIALNTDPMRTRGHARGCRCRSRWDEPPPCDHYLKCYAVAALAWASQPDSTDPYTYCHHRTHFLCTAARCGASRTSPDIDGIPFCAAHTVHIPKIKPHIRTPHKRQRGCRLLFFAFGWSCGFVVVGLGGTGGVVVKRFLKTNGWF